ncbi:MAG: hypothetical protein MUP58_00990 [Candidatus Nanohaloarchaeota archaeon QJJ-9]|nr:hypothetical protein [Candidatus Nanohaloarchaeota archaeon QJJ-9]
MVEPAEIYVHPYPVYDQGLLEDEFEKALEKDSGDKILVMLKGSEDERQPYGGFESYDMIIPDQRYQPSRGKGFIEEQHSAVIVEDYDSIDLCGGNVEACLYNTYQSIKEGEETTGKKVETNIVPELTFGRRNSGFNSRFVLKRILEEGNHKTEKWEKTARLGDYDWEDVGLKEIISEGSRYQEVLEELREL